MFKNVLCLVVSVGLIFQTSDAAPSAIVIAQYTPKLAALAIKIASTVREGSRAIENGEKLIETVIEFSESSINKELDDFNKLVNEKEAEADKENKDITSCIEEEKTEVQKIDIAVIENCKNNIKDIENLKMLITRLAKEEVSLTIAVNLCIIKNPIMGSKLKICFDEEITDVENKITEFKNIVYETIHYIQEQSFNCMNENSKKLEDAIEDVSTEFSICVEKIMDQK